MSTQNDVPEEDVELTEIEEQQDDDGNDTTDWKAEALKRQGIAKRYQTKLSKLKEASSKPVVVEKPEVKQETLDRIDRAVLRVEKITEPDEIALIESTMKESGKSLEQVLAMKYFQSELKEMRELRTSKEAIPSSTRRSSQSSRDSVDYWVAKGELPPASEVKLRRDVVNAKIAQEKQKNHFSPNPVV